MTKEINGPGRGTGKSETSGVKGEERIASQRVHVVTEEDMTHP